MLSFRKEEAWFTIGEEWYVLPVSIGGTSEDDVIRSLSLEYVLRNIFFWRVSLRGWAYIVPYRLYLIHFKWTQDSPDWSPLGSLIQVVYLVVYKEGGEVFHNSRASYVGDCPAWKTQNLWIIFKAPNILETSIIPICPKFEKPDLYPL